MVLNLLDKYEYLTNYVKDNVRKSLIDTFVPLRPKSKRQHALLFSLFNLCILHRVTVPHVRGQFREDNSKCTLAKFECDVFIFHLSDLNQDRQSCP